jgi:PadR family transcriptional regulator, regulatory protein PadR
MKGDYLGAFEELVLLAVQALGDDAYGANIQRTLEREAKRPVSLGAVHTALERLEHKTLLESRDSEPIGERGGRRRRVFTVTRDGRALLRETGAIRDRVTGLRGPATRRSGQV